MLGITQIKARGQVSPAKSAAIASHDSSIESTIDCPILAISMLYVAEAEGPPETSLPCLCPAELHI